MGKVCGDFSPLYCSGALRTGNELRRHSFSNVSSKTKHLMADEKFQKSIQLCVSCAIECTNCATACLNEKELQMLMRCILLNRDCAAMCQVAVGAMTNSNPLVNEVVALCADMCIACAEECEKHKHDHCKRCAKVCRDCAAECRKAIGPVMVV